MARLHLVKLSTLRYIMSNSRDTILRNLNLIKASIICEDELREAFDTLIKVEKSLVAIPPDMLEQEPLQMYGLALRSYELVGRVKNGKSKKDITCLCGELQAETAKISEASHSMLPKSDFKNTILHDLNLVKAFTICKHELQEASDTLIEIEKSLLAIPPDVFEQERNGPLKACKTAFERLVEIVDARESKHDITVLCGLALTYVIQASKLQKAQQPGQSARQGEKGTLWNSIFRSNEWAQDVVKKGLELLLIQTDHQRSYFYLAVTGKAYIPEQDVPALRESLRVPSCNEHEIRFDSVILNIKGIAYAGCPIPVRNIDCDWLKTGVPLSVYTFPHKRKVRVTPRANPKNPTLITLALSGGHLHHVHFKLI